MIIGMIIGMIIRIIIRMIIKMIIRMSIKSYDNDCKNYCKSDCKNSCNNYCKIDMTNYSEKDYFTQYVASVDCFMNVQNYGECFITFSLLFSSQILSPSKGGKMGSYSFIHTCPT